MSDNVPREYVNELTIQYKYRCTNGKAIDQETKQSDQLKSFPKTVGDHYIASILIKKLGVFQEHPSVDDNILLFKSYPCYNGNSIHQSKVEYRKLNLLNDAFAISDCGFHSTVTGNGTYAQRLLMQVMDELKELRKPFNLYRLRDEKLAYAIATSSRSGINYIYDKHVFVISTIIDGIINND